MGDQELHDYIKGLLNQGYDVDAVKETLTKAGHDIGKIESLAIKAIELLHGDLISYIDKEIAKGRSLEDIKGDLLNAGHAEHKLKHLSHYYNSKGSQNSVAPKQTEAPSKEDSDLFHKKIYGISLWKIGVVAVIILFVIIIVIIFSIDSSGTISGGVKQDEPMDKSNDTVSSNELDKTQEGYVKKVEDELTKFEAKWPVYNATSICNQSTQNKSILAKCIVKKSSSVMASNFLSYNGLMEHDLDWLIPEHINLDDSLMFSNNYEITSADYLSLKFLGWWLIADSVGSSGILLFEDEEINGYNLADRREEIAGFFKKEIQQINLFESYTNESMSNKGVYYLSHYPYYNSILLVTKLISEEELKDAKVLISGKEYGYTDISYPLILMRGVFLDYGEYELVVKTNLGEYPITLKVNPDLLIVSDLLVTKKKARIGFTNVGKGSVVVDNVKIKNNKLEVECQQSNPVKDELNYFNQAVIDIPCAKLKDLEAYETYLFNLTVSYQDNESNMQTMKGDLFTGIGQ